MSRCVPSLRPEQSKKAPPKHVRMPFVSGSAVPLPRQACGTPPKSLHAAGLGSDVPLLHLDKIPTQNSCSWNTIWFLQISA